MSEDELTYKGLIYSRPSIVEVYTGEYKKNNKEVAIKILYFDYIEKANELQNEIFSMSRFQDIEGVSKIYDSKISQTSEGKFFLRILMELYKNGDLLKLIGTRKRARNFFSEQELMDHLKRLVKIFAYFQSKNVSHRDIKPENIFVGDDGKLIVGDLGCANESSQMSQTIAGTPNYLSPELREAYIAHLQGLTPSLSHNVYKSDVFSLGLTFLYMACLDDGPVALNVPIQKIEEINSKKMNDIRPRYPEFVNILARMLAIRENERVDFLQLASLLSIEIENKGVITKTIKEDTCDCCDKIIKTSYFSINTIKICNSCIDQFHENKKPDKLYCPTCKELNDFCQHLCHICKLTHDQNIACFEITHARPQEMFHFCSKCPKACNIRIRWLQCSACNHISCVVCNKPGGYFHTLCVILMKYPRSQMLQASKKANFINSK